MRFGSNVNWGALYCALHNIVRLFSAILEEITKMPKKSKKKKPAKSKKKRKY